MPSESEEADDAGRGAEISTSLDDLDLGDRLRGENRGSAGMLLNASAVAGRERRRNARFMLLLRCSFVN